MATVEEILSATGGVYSAEAAKSGVYAKGGTTPSGKVTTTKKTAGKSLMGNVIAKLLAQIAQDTTGAYTAKQQLAAKSAFIESGIKTLNVTPKAAWQYIEHPGVSDYYFNEMQNMVAQGRTDPVQGAKSILGLQAEWARRAEVSPYMTYPSGGVAAGKAHIAPYLEAGGWVSSYEYLAKNPQYAIDFYESDPERAERLLANMYIPGVGITYSGIDERQRALFEQAIENLRIAQAQHTPPWMQAREAMAPIETPTGTLPSWAQPIGAGMTEPRW